MARKEKAKSERANKAGVIVNVEESPTQSRPSVAEEVGFVVDAEGSAGEISRTEVEEVTRARGRHRGGGDGQEDGHGRQDAEGKGRPACPAKVGEVGAWQHSARGGASPQVGVEEAGSRR